MKKAIFITALLLLSVYANAQILTPVHWSFGAKKLKNNEAMVFIKATMDDGWHIYSQTGDDGGPVKTSFAFSPSGSYALIGNTVEPKPVTRFEESFSMNVSFFENSVIFQQKIKLKAGNAVVKGSLKYMTCNDEKCLPPDNVAFSVPVK